MYRVHWALAFGCAFFLSIPQAVGNPAPLPTDIRPPSIEAITQALDTLKPADKPLPEQKQSLADIYQQTLQFLKQADSEQQQLNELLLQLEDAPEETTRLQEQIKSTEIPTETDLLEKLRHQTPEYLKKALIDRQAELSERQTQLANTNNLVTIERARPENNQAIISKNQERLKVLSSQLNLLMAEASPGAMAEAKKSLFLAEMAALQQQDNRLNLEIRNSSIRLELIAARQVLLSRQVRVLELDVLSLQTVINYKRRAASEAAVAIASHITRSSAGKGELLRNEAVINMELSQELLAITDRISEISEQNTQVREQLKSVSAISQSVQQKSVLLGENPRLAALLRESRMKLPKISVNKEIPHIITQARLQKFNHDQERQRLSPPERYVDKLLESAGNQTALSDSDRQELLRLLRTRQKLLEDLSTEQGNLLTAAISLELDQQQLLSQGRDLSRTLKERLYWIASNNELGMDWLMAAPDRLFQQIEMIPWKGIAMHVYSTLRANWLITILCLAFCTWLHSRRRYLHAMQRALTRHIGHIRYDNLKHTPKALALSLLQVLPVPLLLMLVGLALTSGTPPWPGVENLGRAMIQTAPVWLLMLLGIHVYAPHDIGMEHFGWLARDCRALMGQMRRLAMVMVPLFFVVSLAKGQSTELEHDLIGMLLLMTGSLLQAWIIISMVKTSDELLGSKMLNFLILSGLVVVSLGQMALTASGYYYTALQMQHQLVGTLLLVGVTVMIQALIKRNLHVAERRLAYSRAISRRAASSEEGDSVSFEEPTLDLATVEQQSLRLINALMVVGLLIVLYWLWQDLFGLLHFMNNITLWEVGDAKGDVPVYLSDLLLSILVLVTMFILARNLPGLLEVTILSRLNLRPGNSYAATTLLSYTITGLGVVLSLATLGIGWDKLQWLVAALGLGIGIGLQEIVANFFSGLIILFERPVRIGDTITLGEITGEVTRIRIRSTTVTDWDNKEIIIPNKMLVNEKLINWSLSSSVVRIIMPFYVAHDEDPVEVQKLLLQAAREHPGVVEKPEPLALFMEYGDSALQYELRVYVTHVDERLRVRDALNTRIQTLFREHQITVAWPKQDIFFHTERR
ncbi:mechanosensitive channel MscK [Kistimonas scapharcae]|uniref:Mechanosensitive channel MscK n=1 Tax=Kistimonas scapharcae TaxID=1036133 RepID=A0ABP8V6Y2_9GAMM